MLSSFCLTRSVISNEAERQTALSQLECMATMAKRGVEALTEGNLARFDALVGENSCQIRASAIYDLATRWSCDSAFKENLRQERGKVEETLTKIQTLRKEKPSQKITRAQFDDFAVSHGVDLELSRELALLTHCYFLTYLKSAAPKGVIYERDQIREDLLTADFQMTEKAAGSFRRNSQVQLSERSVKYLQLQATLVQEDEPKLLQEMVGDNLVKKDSYNRRVSPFLFCYAVLMKRAVEKNIPILAVLRLAKGDKITEEKCLLFEVRDGSYVEASLDRVDLSKPALVIEGNAKYPEHSEITLATVKNRFMETDLVKIVLANAAIHPQYPGCKDQSLPIHTVMQKDEDAAHFVQKGMRTMEKLKNLALEEGYCKENASTFCIDHVFCDRINNQVKKCKQQ